MRLISKREVMDRVGVTYVTIWKMMNNGQFPRSRAVGGKSMWIEAEVEAWLRDLPVRELKVDASTKAQLRIGPKLIEMPRNGIKRRVG